MKTIKSLAELQVGVGLVYLEDGNAEFYEVVMHHPVQARTFVLMRKPDMKFISVPSATLMDSAAWRIDYISEDVLDYKINYHEQMARMLREHKHKHFKETETANDIEQAAEEFYANEYVRQEKEHADEPISPLIEKDMRKDFLAGWELCKAYYKQKAENEGVIEAQCTAHKVYRNIDGCDYGDLEFEQYINFTEVGLRDGDALDITIRHKDGTPEDN